MNHKEGDKGVNADTIAIHMEIPSLVLLLPVAALHV
jgi:hypothetical protein